MYNIRAESTLPIGISFDDIIPGSVVMVFKNPVCLDPAVSWVGNPRDMRQEDIEFFGLDDPE